MKLNKLFFMIVSVYTLSACSGAIHLRREGNERATQLVFSERYEHSAPFHRITLLVTEDYIWQRNSKTPNEPLIFDKKKNMIYVINRSEKSIRTISTNLAQTDSSPSHNLSVSLGEGKEGTVFYKHSVDGELCYNRIISEELDIGFALDTLREFSIAKAKLKIGLPPKMGCSDVFIYYQPELRFDEGYPIREWSTTGYTRFLDGITTSMEIPEEMFELSEGLTIIPSE